MSAKPIHTAPAIEPYASTGDARKRKRRRIRRRTPARSKSVMVALGNAAGLRWILEFAPIYVAILNGIEHGLREQDQQMQVCSIRSPEEFSHLLESRPPDGLLLLAVKDVASLSSAIGSIPCVSVLGSACEGLLDQVTYNHQATGQLPAEFFLSQGILDTAILGPNEPGRYATFNVRHTSFCETMADGGGRVTSLVCDDLYEPNNPSNRPQPERVAELITLLRQATPRPRGLFVMADNLLPAVYAELERQQITPGRDLHVMSCNVASPYLSGLKPEPSRVDIPAEEIGRRAVELLAWREANPERRTSVTVFTPSLFIPTEPAASRSNILAS